MDIAKGRMLVYKYAVSIFLMLSLRTGISIKVSEGLIISAGNETEQW